MATVIEGFPAPMPLGIDFVTYSNEDLGYTAAYAAGSDIYQFALPYPSSMNLWEETMMVFAIEFIYHGRTGSVDTLVPQGNYVHLSMLGDNFGANWGGSLADAEDETFKAQFAGPFFVGRSSFNATAAASVEGTWRTMDTTQNVMYYPPEPLDLVTPLYVNFTNQSHTITLATNGSVLDDDADFTEFTAVRVWFLKRDYTSEEKRFLNRLPTRFQQLDS